MSRRATTTGPRGLLCAALLCVSGCGDAPTPPNREPLPGQILFSRTMADERQIVRTQLFVTTLDGGDATQLTFETGVSHPTIAPDGRRFAYLRQVEADRFIVVRAMDGRQEAAFLPETPCVASLAWSPDGERLAFSTGCGRSDIWVVNRDGSGLTMLGPGVGPYWSPDGSKIAFSTSTDGVNSRIGIMSANGADWTLFPASSGSDWPGPWSPDGSLLTFGHNEPAVDFEHTRFETWLMRPDGSGRRRLTESHAGYREGLSAWSPDGRYFTFVAVPQMEEWRGARIYVARADGSGAREIAIGRPVGASEYGDMDPSWAPRPDR